MYFSLTRKKTLVVPFVPEGRPFHQKGTLTDHVESKGIENLYIRPGKRWIMKSYAGTFYQRLYFQTEGFLTPNEQINALFDNYLQ